MGLFDKKFCDICGEKIGLLGNRKLEDGNLCKDCAKKLSPWFSDRKSSTVAEIKEQLAYREANKEEVAAFNVTQTYGDYTKLYLDEGARKFLVTSAKNFADANPDVLKFTDVTGVVFDIDESKTEIVMKDKEGKRTSFTPKCYAYSYDFYLEIQVNNPYFNLIRFQLNSSSVDLDADTEIEVTGTAIPQVDQGGPKGLLRPVVQGVASALRPTISMSNAREVQASADYKKYEAMGNEAKEALLASRQADRDLATAAAAPKVALKCPSCGATSLPDANGCCEYCGAPLL